jgi:hypothetical protein
MRRESPRVRDGRLSLIEPRRARALEVDGDRFSYRLVGDLDMAGHNGWRAFANEGVTWAVGWDDDTAVALAAAHALADHPRPVLDSPRTRI